MRLGAMLAGLAILWVAEPAFPDSPTLETFQGPKGNYYRMPPGYLWESEERDVSFRIPKGVEGCTDDGIISAHGPAIGPGDVPCLEVFKHRAAGIYAGYTSSYFSDKPIPKLVIIRKNCKTYRVKTTNIVVDGQSFLKCWGQMDEPDDKSRYMDYFTFSEPIPNLGFHVYIYCPSSGNCNQWVHKWEKLIFDNLHINW
jgi:hypothetical protein